ncbi:MAG: FAD-binding oxidoreductase [Thermodesulfobacteriota bacterium]
MTTESKFIPDWTEKPPEKHSYRSVFKWGSPSEFKHPNDEWYHMLKREFGLTDEDFRKPRLEGNEIVSLDRKIQLAPKTIKSVEDIVGKKNVATDDYSRVRFSHGKTVDEAMALRRRMVRSVPDIVVHPRNKKDVQKIVALCNDQKIPLYVYGGGSSVTWGLNTPRGGLMLVMSTHMNRLLEINELNQTAVVQPGMLGPAYEEALNNAPKLYHTRHRYTCGHFPQSFEYSSVGGWVVTLGSGQASTYYGDACDIVFAQEYVTPAGSFKTLEYPGTATGPKVNDIMKGSEGAFGVLVEVTMKIFRHKPGNRQRFAYMFPSWQNAVDASREIIQGEFGKPAVYRISDAEETEVGLKLFGIHGTPVDKVITLRGYKPMKRCLCMGTCEGEKGYAKYVKERIAGVCKTHGAMSLTGFTTGLWEKTRYKEPYMREDLMDYGIIIDTVESGVTWDKIHRLHEGVRKYIKSRPRTICMTHASHFYPQGTNLYFIFILKMMDLKEYRKFHDGILEAILKNGGSISHHHGVGKLFAKFMDRHLGPEQMAVLRALKRHFDPNNILCPGGQMGLDL